MFDVLMGKRCEYSNSKFIVSATLASQLIFRTLSRFMGIRVGTKSTSYLYRPLVCWPEKCFVFVSRIKLSVSTYKVHHNFIN